MKLSRVLSVLLINCAAHVFAVSLSTDVPVEEFLTELMSVDSTSESEGNLARVVANYFKATGWQVLEQAVKGNIQRPNLLILRNAAVSPGPRYIMCTHLDTVPPYIAPSRNESVVRGRGANDAKGQIAVMAYAAQKIAKEKPNLAEQLGILLVVGEENSHAGMIEANKLGLRPDYLIVGEPTMLTFVTSHKGSFEVKLKAQGKAAHSAYPAMGDSAIHKLLDVLHDIRSHKWPKNEILGDTTVNIGIISGGAAANELAEDASAILSFRVAGPAAEVYKDLEAIAAGRAQIEQFGGKNDPIYIDAPPLDIATSIVAYNTDLPYFERRGELKGVYLFGPGSIHDAHSAQENIRVEDLRKAVDIHVELFEKLIGEN